MKALLMSEERSMGLESESTRMEARMRGSTRMTSLMGSGCINGRMERAMMGSGAMEFSVEKE
jgi:hypothetical protein